MILIWWALGAHWHLRGRTCRRVLYRTGCGHEARPPELLPSCRSKVMQKVIMSIKIKNSDTSYGHVVGIDIS